MRKKKRNIFIPISLLLFLLLVATLIVAFKLTSKNDHVISHRGASGEEIEHTFKAYDLALEYGTKYIEQDLVTSKDGTLYVSHDDNAERITGVDKNYNDMSNRQIDKLKTEDGQHILKLEDVFEKYGDSTDYLIELKENETQAKPFEKLVKEYNLQGNVIVQAKNPEALKQLTEAFPDMPKLALINDDEEMDNVIDADYVDIIGANARLMDKEHISKAHENDKEFNVWTLNTVDEITEAINLDVDSYFTNYTAKALMLEDKTR